MNSPVTSVRERSAVPSDETTQAPASKGKSEGETLKQSANEIAQKQQRLQHIRSILKTSPDNAALRTHEAKLQLEISRMLQKMLGTGRPSHLCVCFVFVRYVQSTCATAHMQLV